jgi:uncharacterized protein YunC (DUF1805 family)
MWYTPWPGQNTKKNQMKKTKPHSYIMCGALDKSLMPMPTVAATVAI